MPELPEVETIRTELESSIKGNTILKIKRIEIKDTISPKVANQTGKILSVTRYGKYLCFNLSNENTIVSHLRMTGQFIVNPKDVSKYTQVQFFFTNKNLVEFRDMRRFGTMDIIPSKKLNEFFRTKVGPDALLCNKKDFIENLSKKKNSEIKVALLDQKVIAGLGNIYAQEVCFLIGVDPRKRVKDLNEKQMEDLFSSMNSLLKKAIKFNGTTFDGKYVNTQGVPGEFFKFLKVYGKSECTSCKSKITKIKQGGRSTYFCLKCQQ